MPVGEQLEQMSRGVDNEYRDKFVSKTKKLLDERASERHDFLEGSLTFAEGSAVWIQDLPILDLNKLESPTNPLMNPEIQVQTPEHAYELFKKYYLHCWFSKPRAYGRGIDDLEKFCGGKE